MGQYNKAITTAAGENLIARAVAGEIQLDITKAKTSDYKYPDSTDFKALTDLQGVKQVMDYPETKVLSNILSNNLIQTRTLFSNEEIEKTYYIHNIGLYAMDGTQEVLFCIVTAVTPDEMPQYNGVAPTSYIYNIQSVVQDAAELNVTVHPSGTATIQDVLERVEATGGDISETVVETLEPIETETKFPIPSAGESIKRFLGKVRRFLKNIKPLESDVTYYVSTTGSDITGDGTQEKPYRNIQYAVDMVPKDLHGYRAFIEVADGTYDEHVYILSFIGGQIIINSASKNTLDGGCNVKSISVQYCSSYVYVNGFVCTHAEDAVIVIWGCHKVTMVYCQSTVSARTKAGIYIGESRGRFSCCRISNRNVALQTVDSTVLSENWDQAGSVNNDYGLSAAYGATIHKTGAQPTGLARNETNDISGTFINERGTQISNLIESGLSCTWGTRSGGYVRHGNIYGDAIIEVNLRIEVTTNLTAGTQYTIPGFPVPIGSLSSVAVTTDCPSRTQVCYMNTQGYIIFVPAVNMNAGTISPCFSASYKTNN